MFLTSACCSLGCSTPNKTSARTTAAHNTAKRSCAESTGWEITSLLTRLLDAITCLVPSCVLFTSYLVCLPLTVWHGNDLHARLIFFSRSLKFDFEVIFRALKVVQKLSEKQVGEVTSLSHSPVLTTSILYKVTAQTRRRQGQAIYAGGKRKTGIFLFYSSRINMSKNDASDNSVWGTD